MLEWSSSQKQEITRVGKDVEKGELCTLLVGILVGTVTIENSMDRLCKKNLNTGLPWWLSGKESASQRWRQGFDPWVRKISHATEQLSSCATTIKPGL